MLPSCFEFQNVRYFRSQDEEILKLIINHIENNVMNPLVLHNLRWNRFSVTYEIDSQKY